MSIDTKTVMCPFCGNFVSHSPGHSSVHYAVMHSLSPEGWRCFCGERFDRPSALAAHVDNNGGVIPHLLDSQEAWSANAEALGRIIGWRR